MAQTSIIVVTFPAQGCINPALQFAKRLISVGVEVNFFTTHSTHRRMINTGASTPAGLSFIPFSDGYNDGFKPGDDINHFVSELSRHGSQTLSNLIISNENQGRPFSCIVYTLLLPWVAEVAHELHLPSALLWVEPATVFNIYYYYFHGYEDLIRDNMGKNDDHSSWIRLPGLPLELRSRDVPSILDAENANNFTAPLFKRLFELLDKESKPKVLVNTFESLEPEALRSISKFDMIGIGPLIPSAFLDYGKEKDPSDTSFGG
ncbi:hypothetical protein FEM48_Zijuj07G0045900 [Ziziphus jujuba var. spinosa]|uniref:Crocetin glucosyltransferase, chloroplastic-like n=1 Tax=Ziziphus jujuba var. spinosa TaxID=714518 RepID=A0A978V2H2_ZIZJJ|nr:hypothetical protein FEM48_Zijuj07G0045900 [Ziziphus jujuba var. spinosa]